MSHQTPFIAGNWKMNGSKQLLTDFFIECANQKELLNSFSGQIVLCLPSLFIDMAKRLQGEMNIPIKIGLQDISNQKKGPYTGELSAHMAQEFGVEFAIVGHSERREYHQESNQIISQKANYLLQEGITPIICVGETLEQREQGGYCEVVSQQVQEILAKIDEEHHDSLVWAYEPVWAIGTGKTASPEQAQEVHQHLRALIKTPILYGGSMKPSNSEELLKQADIDGGLIGGASLSPQLFCKIIKSA